MDDLNQKLRNRELLDPKFMISMYARGAFPMAEECGEINWYLPENRAVILVDDFSVPKSLRSFMQTTDFEFKYDHNISKVIEQCALREKTWISKELIEAYDHLIDYGYLHSVEVYQNEELIGGLYGIAFRGAFFGESMFSKVSQASKSAMVKLFERLNKRGFLIVDVQFMTDHLAMFGTKEIPFEEYEKLLINAYQTEIIF